MRFKAAVLYESNKPLRIEELVLPPLAPGQVLVRIAYSGVCHSQLMEARGKRGNDMYLPHLLGHEGSGAVVETGKGVTKVKQGDNVVLGWIKSKGMDVSGPQYKNNGVVINAGAVTTFSEYSIVSENRCVKLPQGIPMTVAVLFGCALLTGAGIVMHQIKPGKESTAAVFGCGGVGLSALMALNLYDCSRIIAVDVEDDKLKLAGRFGATDLINADAQDPVTVIRDITAGRGVDYAVETAGLAHTIEAAHRSVRARGGLCVFASHPQSGERIMLDPFDLICGRRIEGSWGGASEPDKDVPKLARLYRQGEMPLERLISHKYRLHDINQAFEGLERRKVIRALVEL